MISSRTALREDGAHLRPDKTESVFLINTLENDMSSNEPRQLIAHLPVGIHMDLLRYGICAEVLELESIELMPVPQVPEEVVSTDGCEVHELAVEVVIRDYPASRAWLECNPLWTATGIANKEKANGHVAS
jgi:hypothetical protein